MTDPQEATGADGDTRLAAVMVCAGRECGHHDTAVLGALKPLVARTPRAVLIKTDCLAPRHCPREAHVCAVRLQLCDASLRPVRAAASVALPVQAAYRCVEAWLDTAT